MRVTKAQVIKLREKLAAQARYDRRTYDEYFGGNKPLGTFDLGEMRGRMNASLGALAECDAVFPWAVHGVTR